MNNSNKVVSSGKSSRWEQAQHYESNWWNSFADDYDPSYLEDFASSIREKVSIVRDINEGNSIIEVGCGPVGIVPFLPCKHNIATDPLNDIFEKHSKYVNFRKSARNKGTEYLTAKGEALPFEDGEFDFYITDNVLDHVDSPEDLLNEALRVLKPGGVAYIRLNVYHPWGRLVRSLMEIAVVDKGHPYTFSSHSLEAMVKKAGFVVKWSNRSSYLSNWKKDWFRAFNGSLKALIQALLFVTRARHELIVQRK
ncbi:MAG: class I SAM-dependent methyltransferase [Balneolales bacterium]